MAAYEYAVRQLKGVAVSATYTYYSGSASAPLVLETASGPLPLLAFPAILGPGREIPPSVARPAFEAFAAGAAFVRLEPPGTPERASREGTAAHRSDWRHWEGEPSWPRAAFFETQLRDGETVTIRGIYRAGLGIAADPVTGAGPVLSRGDLPSALLRSRARLRNLVAAAVLFLLLAAAAAPAGRFLLDSRTGGFPSRSGVG